MKTKTRRNDPCPCGSGKKYKRCCLDKDPPRPLSPQNARDESRPSAIAESFPDELGVQRESDRRPQPRGEWDDWYDRLEAADPSEKLDMLRALLEAGHPTERYDEIDFVTAVLLAGDAIGSDGRETYIAFLERMQVARPDVFQLGAACFVRRMAYAYVRTGREQDIAGPLGCLLDDTCELDEPVFDLIDLLRLANLYDEARSLILAAVKQVDHTDLLPWAIAELVESASFFFLREFIEAGGSPDGLAGLCEDLVRVNCETTEAKLQTIVAHRSGTAERRFELQDLFGQGETTGFNLYLLSLDFGRWLATERQIPPVAADALRDFAYRCLFEMQDDQDRNPLAIRQKRLDRYLAQLLGFLSLQHLRGVATLIAVRHFYDFSGSTGLIDQVQHRRAERMCDDLWSQMQRALGDTWPDYAFLSQYG